MRHCGFSVVVLVALACAASAQTPSTQPLPETRMIDVDGVSLRMRTAGLEGRERGRPVIVLESGGGAPLETWDSVFPALAQLAPVVAYDRAGTGKSGWDELPPTPERVGARLRRLLAILEAPPPYLLVGHSWGGALVRYFAGSHPADVAGVLYIDPTDVTVRRRDLIALFESIGSTAADYEAFNKTMMQAMNGGPPAMRAEAGVVFGLLDGDDLDRRGLPPAAPVPTSMILAGRVGVPPQKGMPFDTRAFAQAMQTLRVERLRSWVGNGGTFEVAAKAGHNVHTDDPALVVNAVRQLLGKKK